MATSGRVSPRASAGLAHEKVRSRKRPRGPHTPLDTPLDTPELPPLAPLLLLLLLVLLLLLLLLLMLLLWRELPPVLELVSAVAVVGVASGALPPRETTKAAPRPEVATAAVDDRSGPGLSQGERGGGKGVETYHHEQLSKLLHSGSLVQVLAF